MFPTVDSSPNETNHRKTPLIHIQRLTQIPSTATLERCCFLLIHCLFYIIIFTIIYIRLDQFNQKQEILLNILRSNVNQTLPHSSPPLIRSHIESTENCSCSTVTPPRRNRTTRCVQLRVGSETIENIFCPQQSKTDHRSWLRIQQRESNLIEFNRTWNEYRRGFGHVHRRTDFWIGNENLYWLTQTYPCRLKIELTDWYNETRTATYETFYIANQLDGYRIHLNNYHGDMETANKVDSFSHRHNNARFSTFDHYATTKNCPEFFGGSGWWYHSGHDCAHVQLNGQIATHSDGLVPYNTGLLWIGWKGDRHYSYQRVSMSIQPKSRRTRPSSH